MYICKNDTIFLDKHKFIITKQDTLLRYIDTVYRKANEPYENAQMIWNRITSMPDIYR